MPKERRTRSASFERRSRASPYPCSSSSVRKHSSSSSSSRSTPESGIAAAKDIKEWEEIRCPVCMEHPHNAVLLLCSSQGKGCRPFMCDTSSRHSNCLDQYCKAFSESQPSQNVEGQQPTKLSCPLCRGLVTGWTVVEPARRFLNAKIRSCSMESCGFTGVYGELRKHARKEHPSVRPSEVDPERQRDWQRLEQQHDLRDLISMFWSPISGEEDGIGISEDVGELNIIPFPSITVFLIVQATRAEGMAASRSSWLHSRSSFWGSAQATRAGGMGASRLSLRYSRSPFWGSARRRRGRGMILWGETFREQDSSSRATSDVIDSDGSGIDSGAEEVSVAP
ncbi:uncharacterized protein LOC103698893 [Phoenix dactylifera]|uniref:Uncharacterized protein LOC103698893 n=1 Tax=Phoenix dactylifera TaxID=42345 RepID=A0A8B8ZWR3_PHODC|nr:uncharacterized protein LOC103698893 [Phoenix dactylifera]XP_038978745.1 uncharacterized protein LOC103698893 [Phoenix dactylifera]